MVLLTLIARVRDGLILATSIEGADDAEHNMVKYNSQAKMLFRKLSAPGTPPMQSVASGPYYFHYLIKNNICALCLCDSNFPRKLAFAYLEDIATEFINQNGNKVETTVRPFHFLEFGLADFFGVCLQDFLEIFYDKSNMYIQQTKPKYTDKNRFAMTSVKNELRDVTRIMVSNIEDVLHRGEALNILESRATDLSDLSKKYREDAKRLNDRRLFWKVMGVVSVSLFFILIYRFFIGF